MTEETKKTIVDIKRELEEYLVKEKLSAREILMVVREIENDAMLALVIGQMVLRNGVKKEKDGTDKKVS